MKGPTLNGNALRVTITLGSMTRMGGTTKACKRA